MEELPEALNFLAQRHAQKLAIITDVEPTGTSVRLRMRVDSDALEVTRDLSYKNPNYVYLRNVLGSRPADWIGKRILWEVDGKWMKVSVAAS